MPGQGRDPGRGTDLAVRSGLTGEGRRAGERRLAGERILALGSNLTGERIRGGERVLAGRPALGGERVLTGKRVLAGERVLARERIGAGETARLRQRIGGNRERECADTPRGGTGSCRGTGLHRWKQYPGRVPWPDGVTPFMAVPTPQAPSRLSKSSRAAVSGLPVFQARTISARRCATGWLPMTRVFIEVFPCVRIEVFEQPLNRREAIGCFPGTSVPVIALAGLVVIPQHAFVLINQRQPILIAMITAR